MKRMVLMVFALIFSMTKGKIYFFNIYDFWVCIHASGFMKVNRWYHPKTSESFEKKIEENERPSHNKRLIKEDKEGRQRC